MATSITKPAVISMPFCNSGDKNTIPAAATGTNLASLQEGFPVITGTPLKNGGIPPERRDFNGIANLMSQFYYAFQNGWWPSFDADVSTAIGGYALGAVLWYPDGNYFVKSLKNNNTDNFVLNPSKIDGVSWLQLTAGEFQMPLFTFVWSIHKINDVSYLLANTFSWQSGNVYTEGYQHLVDDISGITPSTETIGGYTITYYQATDGDKIVLADQETTVQNIYNATGNARYFILDTTNTRFKLPRWKHNKYQAKAPVVGNGTTLGLTNGNINAGVNCASGSGFTGDTAAFGTTVGSSISGENITTNITYGITTDPTKSGIEATLETDDMYLYFYVGNYTQSAIEQTAGLNSELFNGKVDLDGHNATFAHIVETYSNGTEWYRVWSDGWCEQGGLTTAPAATSCSATLLKPYIDTNYFVTVMGRARSGWLGILSQTSTSFTCRIEDGGGKESWWFACGYIAQD